MLFITLLKHIAGLDSSLFNSHFNKRAKRVLANVLNIIVDKNIKSPALMATTVNTTNEGNLVLFSISKTAVYGVHRDLFWIQYYLIRYLHK